MSKIVLPEIVASGVYNARLALKSGEVTRKRKVSMFEIELPVEDGGVSYIDGESMPVTRDVVICAKPGQMRRTRLPFKCYFLHVIVYEGELLSRLAAVPTYVTIRDREPFERLFREIALAPTALSDVERLFLQGRVLELLSMLLKHQSDAIFKEGASHKGMIEEVVSYIKENPAADLSLEALAARASFSPIHFHNCFKRATGKTLRAFVEEERLRRAVGLLVGTDKTLAEIAYECGFSSQSYFSYAFRRKMGMTPRAYVAGINCAYETNRADA